MLQKLVAHTYFYKLLTTSKRPHFKLNATSNIVVVHEKALYLPTAVWLVFMRNRKENEEILGTPYFAFMNFYSGSDLLFD